jgi:hypothetical protein
VLRGIFLRATPFLGRLPYTDDEIDRAVERSMRKFFGRRFEAVIAENLRAARRGFSEVFEVPVPAGPQPKGGESPAVEVSANG